MNKKHILIIVVCEVILLIAAVCFYMNKELKTVSLTDRQLSDEAENSVLTEDENGVTITNSENVNGKYNIAEAIVYA